MKLDWEVPKGLATFVFGVLCRCVGKLVDDGHLPWLSRGLFLPWVLGNSGRGCDKLWMGTDLPLFQSRTDIS